ADGGRGAGAEAHRGLHLAGALGREEAAAAERAREAVGAGGPGGDVAAAEGGGDARDGAADDVEAEEGGGAGAERPVVVEERRAVEAAAGGGLGDRGVGDGVADRAGAAAVDEEVAAERVGQGGDDLGTAAAELGEARGLHGRSEEHTSELQSRENLGCRLL